MSNAGQIFPADPLTPIEARALLAAAARATRSSRTALRNRAHLALLWRAGLRAKESCDLKLSDLRLGESPTVRVLAPKGAHGKRRKEPRELGLAGATVEALVAWIEVRGIAPGPLFQTRTGEPIQPSYLRQVIPRAARAAGIQRRVHPHCLRHTFARELYDEGVGIVHIQHALGHDSLQTTAKYLASIGASEVVAVTGARAW